MKLIRLMNTDRDYFIRDVDKVSDILAILVKDVVLYSKPCNVHARCHIARHTRFFLNIAKLTTNPFIFLARRIYENGLFSGRAGTRPTAQSNIKLT